MNDNVINEQLSAYFDNELNKEEKALFIRRLEKDAALRDQFFRYQIIHDSLNNQLPTTINLNFSGSVMAQLENEPTYHSATRINLKKWLKPLSGAAVAASVAMLAIVGAQSLLLPDAPVIDNNNTLASTNAASYRNISQMRWHSKPAEVGRSLNGYLVNHNEYTSSFNLKGMLQYVRIAGYDISPDANKKNKVAGHEDGEKLKSHDSNYR